MPLSPHSHVKVRTNLHELLHEKGFYVKVRANLLKLSHGNKKECRNKMGGLGRGRIPLAPFRCLALARGVQLRCTVRLRRTSIPPLCSPLLQGATRFKAGVSWIDRCSADRFLAALEMMIQRSRWSQYLNISISRGLMSDRFSKLAALYNLCAAPPLLTPHS